MRQLDPEDLKEVERVARKYSDAFRKADAETATAMTIVPVADCIDLGSRCGVYIMDEAEFAHMVREHENEDFATDITSIEIEPLGKNAALARVEAQVSRENGDRGEIEWVEFLARTEEGWKIWANWLGPLPEGF